MLRTFFAGGALTVLLASAASAHIVFAEPEAKPGAYYAGFLRVSHGCGDSPTHAIRVEIPEGVSIARPQPKPGWSLEIERTALATPIRAEGGHQITERVSAITWRGELPADQFDQFGIMMRLPEQSGIIYFPVVQSCANGATAWSQIPPPGAAWGSVPHPAPVLSLQTPPTQDDHTQHR